MISKCIERHKDVQKLRCYTKILLFLFSIDVWICIKEYEEYEFVVVYKNNYSFPNIKIFSIQVVQER